MYLENINESPVWSQNNWVQERGVEMDDRHTSILPLLGLQEKLNFKNFPIEELPQTLLFKCGLKETELCTFCTETKESL